MCVFRCRTIGSRLLTPENISPDDHRVIGLRDKTLIYGVCTFQLVVVEHVLLQEQSLGRRLAVLLLHKMKATVKLSGARLRPSSVGKTEKSENLHGTHGTTRTSVKYSEDAGENSTRLPRVTESRQSTQPTLPSRLGAYY